MSLKIVLVLYSMAMVGACDGPTRSQDEDPNRNGGRADLLNERVISISKDIDLFLSEADGLPAIPGIIPVDRYRFVNGYVYTYRLEQVGSCFAITTVLNGRP